MQDVWLHFRWEPGSDRTVILGAHATQESARLDCPVDLLDPDDDDPEDPWVLEGVAPLGSDAFLLSGLEAYVGLMGSL